MKIIFLDIDGVLNVNTQERDNFGSLFHANFVKNLEKIVFATGAKIVISSSWRHDGLDVMKSMWDMRALPGEIIDVTPGLYLQKGGCIKFWNNPTPNDLASAPGYSVPRGCEIEYWLKKKGFYRINWDIATQLSYIKESGIENYVILDDDSDMLLGQMEHYVRCSRRDDEPDAIEGYGLTDKATLEAIQILNTSIIDLYYK